jgi:hypothetical protein
MRLTLRAMLAYIDDILEPEDAQEISKKIEESEFATNLLHRARDVMQRLRLAAPSVTDRGPGLDPNTVAEYLDNTLPGDRVPDFEKICLDSDVQLAEVASCHQILTLVLGEPVEIDPNSRQRMYQLPELLAAQAKASSAASGATAQGAETTVAKVEDDHVGYRVKTPVPDYLRDPPSRNRTLPIVATIALTVVLLMALLAALGQFEGGSALARLLGRKASAPQIARTEPLTAVTAASPAGDSGSKAKAVEPPPADVSTKPAVSAPSLPPPQPSAPPVVSAVPPPAAPKTAAVLTGVTTPPLAKSVDVLPKPTVASVVPSSASGNPAVPLAANAGLQTPPLAPPLPAAAAVAPAAAVPPATAEAGPAAGTDNSVAGSVAMTGSRRPPRPHPDEPGFDVAPLPPERLGRYISDKQVFLQFDELSNTWRRVPAQGVLVSAQPLMAPPAFQSILALSAGTHVHLMGGTEIELLPSDAQGVSGLNIYFGRLVIRPMVETKPRLRIQVGHRQGLLSFKNGESAVAISVARARDPGVNPELQPGPLAADFYTLTGEVTWQEPGQPPVAIPAPSRIALEKQPLSPTGIQELPKWITTDETSFLDRKAVPVLEQAIQVDRPVALTLRELAEHRQKEVVWLAIRSLGYIGQFEPMVAVLNMPDQSRIWDDYIAQLQMALDRGPETAARVRLALEKRYPQDPGSLYRMLWGYDAKDLQNGQAAGMVDYLDRDLLVFRVLAFYNLEKLTGARFFYRPEYPANKRQAGINKFRDRLQASVVRPKSEDKGSDSIPSSAR